MKVQTTKTQRIHSLDSLRAIMMLLGLVIHAAITYGVFDYGRVWAIKDPNTTSLSNDYIVSFIHSFRMQIFFVVAGFFGAMLFYERHPINMIKNRIYRIIVPFVVFVVLLWPFIVFTFGYTELVFANQNNAFGKMLAVFSNIGTFIPKSTFHLWFLYYLSIITMVATTLALLLNQLPTIEQHISKGFEWAIQKTGLRIIVFAGLTAVVYFIMGTKSVATSTSFVPDFNTFLYYFSFYMVGWVLFKSKQLLNVFTKHDWLCTICGITMFFVYMFFYNNFSYAEHIILKSIMVWLFIFGITGLFIRYGSKHSATMRYISDASYWVYLLHLPLTAFIPSLIKDWPVPSTIKFLFIIFSSGAICFITYHYLVRATFIGKFLNGRKYSKKLSDIKPKEVEIAIQPVFEK